MALRHDARALHGLAKWIGSSMACLQLQFLAVDLLSHLQLPRSHSPFQLHSLPQLHFPYIFQHSVSSLSRKSISWPLSTCKQLCSQFVASAASRHYEPLLRKLYKI